MAKYYTNYDLLKGSDDNIYLYLSGKYYNLSKSVGESRARSSLPKGVSTCVVGDLSGKGELILHALEVFKEVYKDTYDEEPDPEKDFGAWLEWMQEQLKRAAGK